MQKVVNDGCSSAEICGDDYDQSAQAGLPFSAVLSNISHNITHILSADTRIHSALYWLMPFLSATNLSGYSEWIILDHPVAAFCLSVNVQAAAPQDTPEHLPWCNPHCPEQLSLSPTVNSSHFLKNKTPFFRIHRYSAILDGCVSCLGLKCKTDNWMRLPGLTVHNSSVHKIKQNSWK